MKFSDRYKNQMDNIKPDGYIKEKTLRKMAEEVEKNEKTPPKRRVRAYFGSAVAALLCGVIILSVWFLNGRNIGSFDTNSDNNAIETVEDDKNLNNNAMKIAADYGDLYDKIKEFKTSQEEFIENDLGETPEYAVDYEYAVEDGGSLKDATDGLEVADNKGAQNHSDTTVQVEGVDEADIVKTDGKYIYILSYTKYSGEGMVKIVDVTGKKPKQLASIKETEIYASDMYLSGNRLILIGGKVDYAGDYAARDIVIPSEQCVAVIYDVSKPDSPKELIRLNQSGYYEESRLIDGKLYVISNFDINTESVQKKDAATYVPLVNCKDYNGTVGAESVHFYDNCDYPRYTVICGYNIKDGSLGGTQSVLGGSYTVYSSTKNIITCGYADSEGLTQIARFSIEGGKIDFKATGSLRGSLLNQFSIDEYKEHFRFVLTDYNTEEVFDDGSDASDKNDMLYWTQEDETNSLIILDSDLKETGKITDLAPGERVYSVRFMGDTAYFVTFRQVDPLFSADVSDPKNPKIIGSLKIPGFSNYLFPYGDKLLGIGQNADEQTGRTGSMKLSMFDISDPANVTESFKTDVPAEYSEALYNHKAIIVDYEKNIIGFPVDGNTGFEYLVYSYEKGKFIQKLKAEFDINNNQDFRGLYIGNVLYIANSYELRYYDLKTFEPLGMLQLDD